MKIKRIILLIACTFLMTGCFKSSSMDDIHIVTTTYPIEYLMERIYGYNSTIDSIYPRGINVREHKLTDKKNREYASSDLFVYNGLTEEKETALHLLNNNKKLRIIDVSKGISLNNDECDLWLSPSNYLMLAQNIKNGLLDYVNTTIIKQQIEENYDDLRLTISTFDADLKLVAENASNKTLIIGNDVFAFLEKYGFRIINVEENDTYLPTYFQEAKNNITNKTNTYVFTLDIDAETENVKRLQDAGAKVVKINSMLNRTEAEDKESIDYPKLMRQFIEAIQSEVNN